MIRSRQRVKIIIIPISVDVHQKLPRKLDVLGEVVVVMMMRRVGVVNAPR